MNVMIRALDPRPGLSCEARFLWSSGAAVVVHVSVLASCCRAWLEHARALLQRSKCSVSTLRKRSVLCSSRFSVEVVEKLEGQGSGHGASAVPLEVLGRDYCMAQLRLVGVW